MDTIKLLLATTTALLLGALVWNWQTQRDQAKDAPAAELARIKRQLEDIKREEAILRSEKQLRDMGVAATATGFTSPASNAQKELEEKAAKLREIEERNAALQMELEMKEKEVSVAKQEGDLIAQTDLEKNDRELRRARQITQALLMARIMEYHSDPETGDFVTIQLVMPEHVTVDTILSIRRKDGIAGSIKVREIIGGEAVADVLPGAGPFTPQAGDELIVAPLF